MPDDHFAVPLTRNRDFKVVLASQGISAFGDAVNFTALPLLVLALTGSGLAMGVVGAFQTLPDLVFGMVAGAFADRSDRKRLMLLSDLGRAGLTALIPLSVALGGPTLAVILLVAPPLAVLRSFFLAGYTSSLPALVGRSEVGRANSVFETIYSIGYIVGPSVAGVLASTIGAGPTLAIDALSFGISAIGLAFVRRDLRAPVDRPTQPLLADIREGIDYIAAHPTLRSAVLYWGATSIVMAPLVTAITVYVTRELAYEPSVLGLVLTAYGVGTVAGAVASGRLIGRTRPAPDDARRQPRDGPRARLDHPGTATSDPACRGRRRRKHAVAGARDVPHPSDCAVARCPAGAYRQHGPDDLTWPPTDRTARGRRARRCNERLPHDRGHGHRRGGPQPRVPAGRIVPQGVARDEVSAGCTVA